MILIGALLIGNHFAWAGDGEENNSEQTQRDSLYYYYQVLGLTSRSPEIRNTSFQELQQNAPDAKYALTQVLQKTPHDNENALLRAQATWMFGHLGITRYDVIEDRSLGLPSILPIELHEALRDSDGLVKSSAQRAFEYMEITPDEEQILWEEAQRKRKIMEEKKRIETTDKKVRQMLVRHLVHGKPWNIQEYKALFQSLPEEKQTPIREALNAALKKIDKLQ